MMWYGLRRRGGMMVGRAAIAAGVLAMPVSALAVSTHLEGSARVNFQGATIRSYTDELDRTLDGVMQFDMFGNEAKSSGSLSVPGGQFSMSTHSCSGGTPPAGGSATASAGAGVDLDFIVTSATLPPGAPVSVQVNWAISGRLTAAGTELSNVQDIGVATLTGSARLTVDNVPIHALTGSASRSKSTFDGLQIIQNGSLNVLSDHRSATVATAVGQHIRLVIDASVSSGSTAFAPAVTDGDAQFSAVWGLSSLTPNADVVLNEQPPVPTPPAGSATPDRADAQLPPRPPGTMPCFVLTDQPDNLLICPNFTATFLVAAPAPGPYAYRWQASRDEGGWETLTDGPRAGFGDITGATTPSLTISGVQDGAVRLYRCIVSSVCGDVTSVAALLKLKSPDFNGDGNVDQGDVDELISIVAGGGTNPQDLDPDVNGDGNVDQGDVDALIDWVAGGACPA